MLCLLGFVLLRMNYLWVQCSHYFPSVLFPCSHPIISCFCVHILGSLQHMFRVGFPPHVCTCSSPVYGTTLPTTAGSEPLYRSSFTARRKQYSLCLCVVVMTKQWWWLFCDAKRDDELQMKEMVKVKESSQNTSWRGAGGLYDV